jgi:hypothetical protein
MVFVKPFLSTQDIFGRDALLCLKLGLAISQRQLFKRIKIGLKITIDTINKITFGLILDRYLINFDNIHRAFQDVITMQFLYYLFFVKNFSS